MFPQMLLVLFVCNSVRISQNLLNEVPAERCIRSNFANYQPNSLVGSGTIIFQGLYMGSIYGLKMIKVDVKEFMLTMFRQVLVMTSRHHKAHLTV